MSLSGKIILPDERASPPAVRRRDPAPRKTGEVLWESNRPEQPGFQLIVGITTVMPPYPTCVCPMSSRKAPRVCSPHPSGSVKTRLYDIGLCIYLLGKCVALYLRAQINTRRGLCRRSAGEKWPPRRGAGWLAGLFFSGASVKMFDLVAFGVTL